MFRAGTSNSAFVLDLIMGYHSKAHQAVSRVLRRDHHPFSQRFKSILLIVYELTVLCIFFSSFPQTKYHGLSKRHNHSHRPRGKLCHLQLESSNGNGQGRRFTYGCYFSPEIRASGETWHSTAHDSCICDRQEWTVILLLFFCYCRRLVVYRIFLTAGRET